MFTGLVEEVGVVYSISMQGKGLELVIKANLILSDVKIGDSISINGACQTVVSIKNNTFTVETIEETIKKTTLGSLKVNDDVNLERSLMPTSRIGGHFVLGHIDTVGKILSIKKLTNSYFITFSYPSDYKKYLIPVGSIAIDGVSLTVAELTDTTFSVGIIPHTWDSTVFRKKRVGDAVNLEFDVLGKYVIRNMNVNFNNNNTQITEDWLKKIGY